MLLAPVDTDGQWRASVKNDRKLVQNDADITFARKKGKQTAAMITATEDSVPPTNNLAERCARKYKRKAHQVMSFRGDHGDEYFCDALSIIETLKRRELNLYQEIASRFAPS